MSKTLLLQVIQSFCQNGCPVRVQRLADYEMLCDRQ